MSVKFKNGDAVRQVMPAPIQGKVVKFAFDENEGDINYVVQWEENGEVHQRSFSERDLEAVPK